MRNLSIRFPFSCTLGDLEISTLSLVDYNPKSPPRCAMFLKIKGKIDIALISKDVTYHDSLIRFYIKERVFEIPPAFCAFHRISNMKTTLN